ncbi:hypothetical protein [Tsukamurella pseudospumae]|uniref:hypothetical protein n=1 Tax=Tsukamurella pseudospumae TaxID=239498 RepID=UPI0012E94907|nr:hypothetical protein [Tsukamurella pseudospumae]
MQKNRDKRSTARNAELDAALKVESAPPAPLFAGGWDETRRWIVDATESMVTCKGGGCTEYDKLNIDLTASLTAFTSEVLLWGELKTDKGTGFDVYKPANASYMCEVKRDERLWFDSVVGRFPNCTPHYDTRSEVILTSDVSDLPPNQEQFVKINFIIRTGQQEAIEHGVGLRIPKQLTYQSPVWRTNADGIPTP